MPWRRQISKCSRALPKNHNIEARRSRESRAAKGKSGKFFLEHLAGPCTHFGDGLWLF